MLDRVRHDLSEDWDAGHRPLTAPRDHPAWLMGLRLAIAVGLAGLLARWAGYSAPSWAIITAAYLAVNPPAESLRAALGDLLATAIGIALGLAGAWAWSTGEAVPIWHFMGIAFVAGLLATRNAAFIYTIVVGTVVAFSAGGGGDGAWTTALDSAAQIAIASVTAPAVVWTLEFLRAKLVRGS